MFQCEAIHQFPDCPKESLQIHELQLLRSQEHMQTLMQTLGQINMVELDGRSGLGNVILNDLETMVDPVETIQLEMLKSTM